MIAMSMGQVNRGQVLAARHNPVRQSPRSFGGKEGIDQHSIPFAVDHSRLRPGRLVMNTDHCKGAFLWFDPVMRTPP